MIRWVDAFLDRPSEKLDDAVTFWATITGSTPAPQKHPGFVRLRTAAGDDWLELQGVREGPGGHHPDIWVDDRAGFNGRALTAGGTVLADHGDWQTLRSPAGLRFCTATWRDQHVRPRPYGGPGGVTLRPHQLCFDLAPAEYDREVHFWRTLTGWELDEGEQADEFVRLQPQPPVPIRFLFQRLDSDRPASIHLDVSCSDIPAARTWHESLGATLVGEWPHWSTFRDPAGGVYCLTSGDPATD
ncbi:hypothetical protein Aab01nite_41540 [Paractinoplanes abujensis]|uniref:Glyoxalase-like domain-containing protein n=1 Tax=Paractinoplanes abujensis TaxID=882441 RepID=A0A7W7G2V2_9ACTN|nr:VOC family protein [Actinoplanes abujensis]MBB4694222.1 hypothetical protein [Actinoplanes abujensis]GID20564.1 hypothetical protein Aab01nite_41540 [Actinoplanes abujensis]